MKKILDWASIEIDYIHGYINVDDRGKKRHIYPTADMLANKYNCSLHSIQQRMCQEKWTIRREQYREKLKDLKIEKANQEKAEHHVNILMSESSKYDTQNLQKLDQVDKILNIFLRKYNNFISQEIADFMEDELDIEQPKIDLKEVNLMMDILLKRHQLSRAIFGEPSATRPSEKKEVRENRTKVIAKKATTDKENNLEKIVDIIKTNQTLKQKLIQEKEQLEKAINET